MSLEHAVDKRGARVQGGRHFVTISELMTELGWSRRTIYRRIDDGTLAPPIKLNKSTNAWPRSYVESLIEQVARGEAKWQA
jgi:predicted DNA-binding transcriptional regulator AlpA